MVPENLITWNFISHFIPVFFEDSFIQDDDILQLWILPFMFYFSLFLSYSCSLLGIAVLLGLAQLNLWNHHPEVIMKITALLANKNACCL